MQQTLFMIPPWLFQGPLLIAWIVLAVLIIAFSSYRNGWNKETMGFVPVLIIVGVFIHFVLPSLMIQGTNPDDPNGPTVPIGLAIRGYGVFMLLAILSGVGVAMALANKVGFSTERLMSLAFWMVVCGLIGARAVYVIQYGGRFQADTLMERLRLMVDMTKGGLVVYGSLIGSMAASIVLKLIYRFKYWQLIDLIAPAFMIGLSIGRIGCLLNGCCFGGDCEVPWAAVKFPAGSPPYMRQLETGQLMGLKTKPNEKDLPGRVVLSVESNSLAEELQIKVDDIIEVRHAGERVFRDRIQNGMKIDSEVEIATVGKPSKFVGLERFENVPLDRSMPIHPTQIYSSVNGLLLFGILFFYFPYRRRDGDAFALLLIIYPITRFLLEYVRSDESAIDALGLFTISQWISVAMMVVGLLIFFVIRNRPLARYPESVGSFEPDIEKKSVPQRS